MFPSLQQKTVFIAAPGDMAYLRQAVRQELHYLKEHAADDRGVFPYLWEIDKSEEGFSPYLPAQEDIPLPSDPNCLAVICIFGERIGTPLPADFPVEPISGSFAFKKNISHPLLHPFPKDEADPAREKAFPLTGSIFEYLAALSNSKQVPLLLLFIGNKSLLDKSEKLLNKKWGMWRLRNSMKRSFGENEEGYDEWKQNELRPQLTWLNNFLQHLVRDRGKVIDIVESEEEARIKIRQFLQEALDLKIQKSSRDPFKHLESYDIEDNPVFFGRSDLRARTIQQIESLLNEEKRLPFFGILGPSGAGKSSFLRAGIVAHLTHTLTMGHFASKVIRPGDLLFNTKNADPLLHLFLAVTTAIHPDTDRQQLVSGYKTIKEDSQPGYVVKEITRALKEKGKKDRRLVLGLDQFEECIDNVNTPKGKKLWGNVIRFLKLAVESKSIIVIYTLLNNRLDELHKNNILADLFNEGETLTISFPTEIEQIITGPFHHVNLELERQLFLQLRDAIQNFSDADASILPLISVALSRIYYEWQKKQNVKTDVDQHIKPVKTAGNMGSKGDASIPPVYASSAITTSANLLTLAEYKDFVNIESCINDLGEKALENAKNQSTGPDEQELILGRLLRRLVRLSTTKNNAFDLCSTIIPKDLIRTPLFQSLIKNRIIIEESGNRYRLVHESVLLYWKAAENWTYNEKNRIRIQARLLILGHEWKEENRNQEIIKGLGDNDINGAGELLYYWGNDLNSEPAKFADQGDSLLLEFIVAALKIHSKPTLLIPGSTNGTTFLHAAANAGVTELVEDYLAEDPTSVEIEMGDQKRTPLFYAAQTGKIKTLKLLLDHGADVNKVDSYKWTPLFIAIYYGHVNIIEFLIAHDADVTHKGQNEFTPLHLAAYFGQEQPFIRLLEDSRINPNEKASDETPLHFAASRGYLSIVSVLLKDKRVDPNPIGKENDTPLHKAIYGGHDAVVTELLKDKRVNINAKTKRSLTPLHLAALYGNENIIKLLLKAKCDYNTLDDVGRSAIMLANGTNSDIILQTFIDLTKTNADSISFWFKPIFNKNNQVKALVRITEEELSNILNRDIGSLPIKYWPILPAFTGIWRTVNPNRAVNLLKKVITILPAAYGHGIVRIETLRETPLKFYGKNIYFIEALSFNKNNEPGILTFVSDEENVTVLDGTSSLIYKLNSKLNFRLKNATAANQYLHFFNSAIRGDDGTFGIIDDQRQISWSSYADKEIIDEVNKKIFPSRFIKTFKTEEKGKIWQFSATVFYNNIFFSAEFDVSETGEVGMANVNPFYKDLLVMRSIFHAGLRVLLNAKNVDAEKSIFIFNCIKEIFNNDLSVEFDKIILLADIFVYPKSTLEEISKRTNFKATTILTYLKKLNSEKIVYKKSDNSFLINRHVELLLETTIPLFNNKGAAGFKEFILGFPPVFTSFNNTILLRHCMILSFLYQNPGSTIKKIIEWLGVENKKDIEKNYKELLEAGIINVE